MSLLPALAGQAAPLLEVVLPLALLWDRFEFSNRVHDCLGLKERFEYSVLAVSNHLGNFPLDHSFECALDVGLSGAQHLDSANSELLSFLWHFRLHAGDNGCGSSLGLHWKNGCRAQWW